MCWCLLWCAAVCVVCLQGFWLVVILGPFGHSPSALSQGCSHLGPPDSAVAELHWVIVVVVVVYFWYTWQIALMSDYICKRLSAPKTICQDLQVLILKRLPVKTLLRCRCVCKWWKDIIASKCFVLDHLAIQRPRLIAQNSNANYLLVDTRTLPSCDGLRCPNLYLFVTRDFVIVGGVHGVMCLYDNADRLFLCNPSTRQSFKIPLRGLWVCHESIGSKYCGFWIDPSNKDFKIVIFQLGRCASALLFSSRKPGAWTQVDASGILCDCCACFGPVQVLTGELAYWMAYADQVHRPRAVLFFDFDKDKFGSIELPEPVLASKPKIRWGVNVCKWRDTLSIVHWQVYSPKDGCDLWAMRNGTWSKMLSFDLIDGIREVHCVLEDCGSLVVSDHGGSSRELLYYDAKDRRLARLESKFLEYGRTKVVFDYVESLVFPDPTMYF